MRKLFAGFMVAGALAAGGGSALAHTDHTSCAGGASFLAKQGGFGELVSGIATSAPRANAEEIEHAHSALCQPRKEVEIDPKK